MRLISDKLRFFDPQTEKKLLSYEERHEARIQAEQQLKASKASLESEQQKLEEVEKTLNAAVPKLLAMGLSIEQVASALSWSVEKVRRLIKQ